ncbi:MAG: glycosyltransferase family 39 protein [Pseudomonadales bacterium]|nr:glycosyltransferase family 39 protein [Pseudomonadales bacterium]
MDNSSPQSLPNWSLAICFALLGATITYFSSSLYGPGLSSDSAGYFNLADDISKNGFQFLYENKSVTQPPLYPVLLSLTSALLKSSQLEASLAINVFSCFLLILMLYHSAYKVSKSIAVSSTMGILCCVSVPLTFTWSMAWTEPLFITLVFASLYITTHLEHKKFIILIAGIVTAAAILTRYVGVIMIPLLFLYIAVHRTTNPLDAFKKGMIMAILPTLVLFAYATRNFVISDTWFGDRYPGILGLEENISLATLTIFSWFIPIKAASLFGENKLFLLFVLLVITACFTWLKRNYIANLLLKSEKATRLHLYFILIYTAFIIWTSTNTAYDHIDSRLLSPIYPSIIIVISFLLAPEHFKKRKLWKIFYISLSLVLIITPLKSTIYELRLNLSEGAGGYNTKTWRDSQLMNHLKETSDYKNAVIFTNASEAIFLLAGINAVETPAKRQYNSQSPTGVNSLNLFEIHSEFDGALLAWFDNTDRAYFYNPQELSSMSRLSILHRFEDGTLYKVERPRH